MSKIQKVLLTGKTRTTSSDGRVIAGNHEGTLNLELSAPGRSKEDFKVSIENGLLTISYEKKEEVKNDDVKNVRREFSFKSFKRSFSLDEKVDAENIQANFVGMLHPVQQLYQSVAIIGRVLNVRGGEAVYAYFHMIGSRCLFALLGQ